MAETALSTDIAIIGGGPVGLVTAMSLEALGVRSVLVNTQPATRMHPKGSTQNARTMEHYRRLGVAKRMRALGLPKDYPTDVGYFTRLTGRELARIPMPSEAEKQARLGGAADPTPEPILRCNQMYAEAFRFEHVKTLRRVTVRYGWECVGLAEDGDGITVTLADAAGRRETVRAAYLVGADGAQGFVRRRLGIRYGGWETLRQAYLGGPMVATFMRIPEFYRRVPVGRCWQYWTVNRDVRSNIVALDGDADFIFNGRLASPDETPNDDKIAAEVRASLGCDIAVEFVGHWAWTGGQALVADSFGAGRVLLAGDAVHLFTPTGGFGMNTGIDDAANLAWKLASLVQGWGGPGLLPSYEIERRPVARRNTQAARQLALNVGAVPLDPAIEEDGAAGEAARRAASDFLATFGEEFASLGVQLGARYDGSPLVVDDGSAPPPADPAVYVPSACPGGRAPHLWLDRGVALFDRLGPGFTLLRLGKGAAEIAPLQAAARERGVPLAVLDVPGEVARDRYARDLALIRPDQHVAWRGNRLPADCAALLARVTGG